MKEKDFAGNTAHLGYTGAEQEGKSPQQKSTRQLQMGLVRRRLKPSDFKWSLNGLSKWTSVQMETCLSELLVQTLLLASGERENLPGLTPPHPQAGI